MKKVKLRTVWLLSSFAILFFTNCSTKKADISSGMFKHHYITEDMPKDHNWGYGTPAMADFDKDGDMDYAFCVREDSIYWFENRGADSWKRHTLGKIPIRTLGATVIDVDADGWTDIVIGGYWYRNPRSPIKGTFSIYSYDNTIENAIHDIVTADVDGDGKLDVVSTGDKDGCFWYKIPPNPKQNVNWSRITVTMTVLDENDGIHSGFSPRGVADLDNDRDVDIVMPDRWYENKAKGTSWIKHILPFGKRGPWGLSSRSWVIDMDKDGDNDIVIVDSDQRESRAAWLENNGASPPSFTAHFLPQEASGTRGSFHSLGVADFDGDSDPDIFTVEQEDDTILPSGSNPRWYIWENLDGRGGSFAERVIFDGTLGGHDAYIGDVDGDGDIDICSKIWKRWADNVNGGKEHADFLENLSNKASGTY